MILLVKGQSLGTEGVKKLSPLMRVTESDKCKGLLADQECFQALQDMDNDETPGSDVFISDSVLKNSFSGIRLNKTFLQA